jgi:hypothetical protein
MGLPTQQISEKTGLSEREIENLKIWGSPKTEVRRRKTEDGSKPINW